MIDEPQILNDIKMPKRNEVGFLLSRVISSEYLERAGTIQFIYEYSLLGPFVESADVLTQCVFKFWVASSPCSLCKHVGAVIKRPNFKSTSLKLRFVFEVLYNFV